MSSATATATMAAPTTPEKTLRSPICCVLGHVDTGKTLLLDRLRGSFVQAEEVGGITQQIGATYIPKETARDLWSFGKEESGQIDCKIPGLLLIDTPGHESFANLRIRGTSACDIAILLVDIMHGLEPQTIAAIQLLRQTKTPFVVALNKIDLLYGWQGPRKTIKDQPAHTYVEFKTRLDQTIAALATESLNATLFSENKNSSKIVSIVPVSAKTGYGMDDLMALIVQLSQTKLTQQIATQTELKCTSLEVKPVQGLGTVVDALLINGSLRTGDTIVVGGMDGAITTTIRNLLLPPPMKDMRSKKKLAYSCMDTVTGARAVRIVAPDLQHAMAGTPIFVLKDVKDTKTNDEIKTLVMQDYQSLLSKLDKKSTVHVQASTLGALEALVELLRGKAIGVRSMGIGPLSKKDLARASASDSKTQGTGGGLILAFDIFIAQDLQHMAKSQNLKIVNADIVYHLVDQCVAHFQSLKEEKQRQMAGEAIFPCILQLLPDHIYRKKSPIVVGVTVLEGVAKIGTPLVVMAADGKQVNIGKITSMQIDSKDVQEGKTGAQLCIKIEQTVDAKPTIECGRHFVTDSKLVSCLSRKSIDCLKTHFKDALGDSDWRLVIKLKKLLSIV